MRYSASRTKAEDLRLAAIAWEQAKEDERKAAQTRREIEDYLASESFGLSEDFEGTANFDALDYDIKVTGRMNRKVDEEKLQQLAAESGLTEHLPSLFRFKAEIKIGEWKKAHKDITGPLSAAIETKPGRPSFDVVKRGEKV